MSYRNVRRALALGALAAALVGSSATAQPAQTETIPLFNGCNNVALTWSTGTNTADVAAAISPASALASIWKFNNAAQSFTGFSPQFPAQSDYRSVTRFEPVFICMNGAGTLNRPVA